MKSNISIIIAVLASCVILCEVHCTLSPSNKSKKGSKTGKEKELKIKVGPQQYSVFDRNLIEDEPSARDILSECGSYYKDTQNRLFNGTVLGYVMSWNNHGYDVAKIWGPKFDVISPLWLQVVRLPNGDYQMNGEHDVDSGWLKDVRNAAHHKNKIMPRVLFEQFTDKDFSKLLTYERERTTAISLILKTCQKHGFNGIVLEIWSQLAARVEDKHLIDFVTEIAKTLRSHNMETVLVIPPVRKEMYDLFSKKQFDALYPVISWFSLMTYDFSSIQRPGANASLYWMRNAVEHICPDSSTNLAIKRSKILLGLNLYGNDFTPDGGSAIIGHEFLNFLKYVQGRLSLDDTNSEKFFEVKTPTGRHIVFYPTLYSVHERIQLARELGTGISLWELLQGLDYFYDLDFYSETFRISFYWIFLVSSFIHLLSSILLCIGVHKRNHYIMLPWIVVNGIYLIPVAFVGLIGILAAVPIIGPIYIWWCICMHYLQIQDDRTLFFQLIFEVN